MRLVWVGLLLCTAEAGVESVGAAEVGVEGTSGVGTGDTEEGGLAGDTSLVCWGTIVVVVGPVAPSGSALVSLDGELGHELCGEIGGVGGI